MNVSTHTNAIFAEAGEAPFWKSKGKCGLMKKINIDQDWFAQLENLSKYNASSARVYLYFYRWI